MAKSRARYLSELLGSDGLVQASLSALAGADGIVDLEVLPTIPNSQLENSTITISGNSISLGGSHSLDTSDLSDVTITSASTDQILKYNGTAWVNADLDAGSITTSTTAPVSPNSGDLWWNSESGQLKIYYTDTDSSQWVDAAASASVQEVTLSFPFFNSSTALDSIVLISNQNLPFFKANGTQDNITVTS